jgi:hypothetical protein
MHADCLAYDAQVLARFKGFSRNKLETLRLAAALYSRLLSMALELEKWEVQGPVLEHLEKVTRYFEKVCLNATNLGCVTLTYE